MSRQRLTVNLQKAWLVLVLVLLYVPMASVVLASLSDTRYMQFPHKEWTVASYSQALSSYTTTTLHLTSLQIALVVVILAVLIATCGALAFARYDWR
ncbi:MAG: ABC transporter permease, partial [Gammaproteobacteria bacterium]|nr:ABC transporter permease [Gammaproteobacteria bacterium]